ncbi:hypothetical protein COCNU_scaffold177390G000010 [Cocos nucifera]|nr:hypothetical protein [Cocos nucifera]
MGVARPRWPVARSHAWKPTESERKGLLPTLPPWWRCPRPKKEKKEEETHRRWRQRQVTIDDGKIQQNSW